MEVNVCKLNVVVRLSALTQTRTMYKYNIVDDDNEHYLFTTCVKLQFKFID